MDYMIDIPNVDRDERIGSAFDHLMRVIQQTEAHEGRVIWNLSNISILHPFFLVPLAIYKQRHKDIIKFANIPSRIASYLELIHFNEPLSIDKGTGMLESYISKSYLPICRFDLHKSDADSLQGILQRIILEQSKAAHSLITPLSYFFSELICNMTQHSRGNYGYVFSQYLRKEDCINLVLADDGITVYSSYVRTKKYLDEIKGNEANALRIAYEGKSTKGLPYAENRGFGLSSSEKMLVEGLHGLFFMLSGGAFHRHDRVDSVFIDLPEDIYWEGTIILMRIPTNPPTGFDYSNYTQ